MGMVRMVIIDCEYAAAAEIAKERRGLFVQ